MKLATEGQLNYYNDLAEQRGMPRLDAFAQGTTSRDASRAIEELLRVRRPRGGHCATSSHYAHVPDGHYALPRVGKLSGLPGDDKILFFRLNTGKSGRYEGYRFVDRMAGENREPVRHQGLRDVIMKMIESDVLGAASLYGSQIGRCGICRKELTDDDSRVMGIGPDCFQKITGHRRTKVDVENARAASTAGSPHSGAVGDDKSHERLAAADVFAASSAALRDRMETRIAPAIARGDDPVKIIAAIRDDERLTEKDKIGRAHV